MASKVAARSKRAKATTQQEDVAAWLEQIEQTLSHGLDEINSTLDSKLGQIAEALKEKSGGA